MNIYYKKNINNNYICIEKENHDASNEFETMILSHNTVPGLLEFSTYSSCQNLVYQYDITGMQALNSYFENNKLNYETYAAIVNAIKAILQSAENYMFSIDNLLLDIPHIYLDLKTKKVFFTFFPDKERSFDECLKKLLATLLNYIEHEDEKCVLAAYSVQQRSISPNASFGEILSLEEHTQQKSDTSPLTNIASFSDVTDSYADSILDSDGRNIIDISNNYASYADIIPGPPSFSASDETNEAKNKPLSFETFLSVSRFPIMILICLIILIVSQSVFNLFSFKIFAGISLLLISVCIYLFYTVFRIKLTKACEYL